MEEARPRSARLSGPLSSPAFRAMFLASIASYVGTFVHHVAEAWVMMDQARDPMLVSLLTTALMVPSLLLTVPAGALADRVDRRMLLFWAQLGSAAVTLGLAAACWLHLASPAVLLAGAAGMGVFLAFTGPPWQSLVPELAGRQHMAEAVTLNAVAFNVARVVGPAIGGFVLGWAGAGWSFALDALSFAGVLWVLARYPEIRAASAAALARAKPEPWLRSMVAPLGMVARSSRLRASFVGVLTFSLAASAVTALLPLVAKHHLHTGASGYGSLLGALGLGATACGIALRWVRRLVAPRVLVTGAMALYGACSVGVGLAGSLPAAWGWMLLAGFGWVATFSTMSATAQLASPEHAKSRVVALYQLTHFLGWAGGAAAAGAVATHVGERTTLVGGAVAALACAALASRLSFAPSMEAAPQPTPVPTGVRAA
jgi:MFS family permease